MWNGVPEEDAVRALLERAGPRAPLAEEDLAALQAKAREQWRRRYGSSPHPAGRRWWLAAAAAALLVGFGFLWRARTPAPAASVARLSGTARIQPAGKRLVELSGASVFGSPIAARSQIETTAGSRLALKTSDEVSVRLDAATRVRLVSPRLIELAFGSIYVDTGGKPGGIEELAVRTRHGTFRPHGTQFEVHVEPGASATRLRVREGKVALDDHGPEAAAAAGQELIVRADGSLERALIPADASSWRWTLQAAPMLDIEGVTVKEYLDWLVRETGWRVEFADREAAARADTTVLHGSIDHLTPEHSPGVVLASCGLGHRISGGTLVIFLGVPTSSRSIAQNSQEIPSDGKKPGQNSSP
jgi:hypothetical protein